LQDQLIEANTMFIRTTDCLKSKERDLIDTYAVNLVDMAAYLTNSWLLLRDARLSPRKRDLARAYIAEHLPHIHSAGEAILAADSASIEVRESILSEDF
jgi:hypothetical protein